MNKLYSFLTGLSIFVSGLAPVMAQSGNASTYDLLFSTGTIKPVPNAAEFKALPAPAEPEILQGYYFRVLQFDQIPGQQMQNSLKAAGILLHNYMPHNAYFASLPVNADKQLLQSAGLRVALPVSREMKLSAALLAQDYPAWAMPEQNHIDLEVQYYPSLSPDAVLHRLGNLVRVIGRNDFSNQLTVRVPVSNINDLAAQPFLYYIEAIDPPAEHENLVGRTSHRSNTLASDLPMGRQYNGLGVNVALGDDGIIGPHIDFTGRANQSQASGNTGDHGDHVAGIIMGAGNRDPKTRGMAFGADIHVFNVWDAINSTPTTYNTLGIRLTSTSYGNGCNAGYTSFARTADQQVRQMPALMHVFSAGNSGTSNCGYGAGSGWGNITGGVKVGKNVIAVANMTYTDGISNSSSRGPAHDGRIKPDIAAVGTNVYSTIRNDAYQNMSGTSMACPGVTGTLAQLYQAYRDLNNGADPASGLLKGIIMNTADDLGNAGPDYTYGYGRINALRAVRVLEDNTYLTGTASQGSADTYQIAVPAGTRQLRAMVYWTDFEASSNAAIALVNNLNMQVTAPNATVYNPWVLNHAPNATTLNAPATRGVDNLNNVEQVTINTPAAGNYTISVSGAAVPQGPQPYFVIYTFIKDEIELTYPIGGEAFVPGQQETIRWDAYGSTGSFSLQYSLDSGSTWTTLSSTIGGSARHYNWTVGTNLISGNALMRISRGSLTDISDATFTIVRTPANINFAYICPDSLKLQWNPVAGASGYEISRLGAKYMDSVGTTTATSFMVYGTDPTQVDWFSVKALTPDGGIGRRANAVKKPLGSQNCIIPDLALLGITSPVSGCHSALNSGLCLSVQNLSNTSISTIPVSISVDSASPVTHIIPGPIAAGATLNYCFPAGIFSFAPADTITITASINYPGDIDLSNNQQSTIVTLFPEPVVSINPSGSGVNFSFTGTAAGAATYAWSFGDGTTSALPDPVHTYAVGGTYTVSLAVTDSSGCSGTGSVVISAISGMSKNPLTQLRLYPNPSPGEVTLEWEPIAGEQAKLEVSTIQGQLVWSETISTNQHQLNLRHLANGAYVVKLTNPRVSAVSRIMLQQ